MGIPRHSNPKLALMRVSASAIGHLGAEVVRDDLVGKSERSGKACLPWLPMTMRIRHIAVGLRLDRGVRRPATPLRGSHERNTYYLRRAVANYGLRRARTDVA